LADQWDLSPLPRNPAVLAALENRMAEQETAKEWQDPDMSPRQTAETIPIRAAPVPGPEGAVALEADLQAHIGRQLRAVYEEVVNEAVPDRFLKLLEELDRKKAKRS
jgi:hypothetical protein